MKRSGPTNYELQNVLVRLEDKAQKSAFWKRIMKDLKKPTRQRRTVNVYTINKCAREGETVVVPGKVLSVGDLTKKVDVAALQFSEQARRKIEQAQGKVLTISELLEVNPDGKKARILG